MDVIILFYISFREGNAYSDFVDAINAVIKVIEKAPKKPKKGDKEPTTAKPQL